MLLEISLTFTIFVPELIQRDINLRDIKKDIEYVIGAFVDDCTLFLNVNPGKDTQLDRALQYICTGN